jgi:hypothetical protein
MAEVRPSEQLGTRLGPSIIVLSRIGRDDLRGATAMKSLAFCFTLLSTIAISIPASLPAPAAPRARVFVSVTGDDANPCTAGSPCKTFQHAHDVVQAGGEISVLDTGGYGTLIISKALSIVTPAGVEASIAIPNGGTGITISANSIDAISLRGLTLDGTGIGQFGIVFNSGQSLTIDNCVVRNMFKHALSFVPTTAATLAVSNSFFNDNNDSGIFIGPSGSGAVSASIDRAGFYGNGNWGLFVSGALGTGDLTVAAMDSVAANNNIGGFAVHKQSFADAGGLS